MNLKDIAIRVGGRLAGDASLEITGAAGLEFAGPADITFVADQKHLSSLAQSRAGAVLIAEPAATGKAQIIHPHPAAAFSRLAAEMHPEPRPPEGVDSQASLGENVKLGDGVAILAHVTVGRDVTLGARTVLHPGVVIGDGCTLGADTVLHPNVVLYRKTQLGSHVIVHAGAVIGADGFGYVLDEENHHGKIPQIGRVVIEDHVEIGANTCIDRATFGETVIRQGTKIDNLVQVAHNCTVGDHSILVSQSGLSGSCRLGRYNVLAGQVGLADHVTLADEVTLAARAGTFRDLPEAGVYGGAPAMPLQEYGRLIAVFLKLPDMAAQVRNLERRLQKIEKG